jgi:tetratricopeptide (TPR) repeat protein
MMNHRRLLLIVPIASAVLCGCAPKKPTTTASTRPVGIDNYVQAVQSYDQGNKDAAVSSLTQAIQQNPNLTMARNLLASIYRDDGDYAKAADQYEAVTRLDPYWWTNHYNLALCYQFLDRLQAAAASYARALKLNPNDMKSNMNLGLVYLGLGQYDQAAQYGQRAVDLDPKSATARANLGIIYDARGEYTKAESAYRQALELDSSQQSTLLNLGSNLIMQGKTREAVATLQQALKLADTALARKRLGDAYAANKQYDEALKEYNSALKNNPRYFPAMNEMGLVLIEQYRQSLELDEQKKIAAVAIWERSLQIQPNQPRVQQWVRQWSEKEMFAQ